MHVDPRMKPLLQLCVGTGKILLLIGGGYLLIALTLAYFAADMPNDPAARGLIADIEENGLLFAGVMAVLAIELLICSWMLRGFPPDQEIPDSNDH